MESNEEATNLSLGARLGLAFKVLLDGKLAGLVDRLLRRGSEKAPVLPPERVHASGLFLLNALQREGRFVDFLQQNVSGFSDEEVGAAARVVHAGCGKVIKQYFDLEPASKETEGAQVTVPKGFDAERWRLVGNVTGEPPFRGTLKHHGWVVRQVRMPTISPELDPRVIAPAEVELA